MTRPRCFAQECEARLDGRIELKTTHGNAPSHFAPSMPLNKLIDDLLQGYAVQGIVEMGPLRRLIADRLGVIVLRIHVLFKIHSAAITPINAAASHSRRTARVRLKPARTSWCER